MTDLEAEFDALRKEHAALEAAFHHLEHDRRDINGHRELLAQLGEHRRRLRSYKESLRKHAATQGDDRPPDA